MLAVRGQSEIERLAATESLLRIGTFSEPERELLLRCIATEDHPYVLKNLLLLLPRAEVRDWQTVAEGAALRCPHQIVVDSLCWVKSRPMDNVLALPDVEPPYSRQTRYPDLEFYAAYLEVSG